MNRFSVVRLIGVVALIATAMSAGHAAAQGAGADALAGKTIRFVIGASAGGSTDRYARNFIGALEPLLPNASLVAQNVAGGNGVLALVEAATASPNLITLVFFQAGPIYSQLREPASSPVDISQFHPIGSLSGNQRLVIVRSSLAANSFADLVALDRQLVAPTDSVTAANHIESTLIGAITDLHLKIVTGVGDELRDPLLIAGDADLTVSGYLNSGPLLESGAGVAVLRMGESGYPAQFESLPTLADVARPGTPPQVVEIMDTLNALGRLLMAAPETDPAAVDALRGAFDQLVVMPSFVQSLGGQGLSLSPMSGVDLEERMLTLLADTEAGDLFRAYLACGDAEAAGAPLDCTSPLP